jgi:hypothetical protein
MRVISGTLIPMPPDERRQVAADVKSLKNLSLSEK